MLTITNLTITYAHITLGYFPWLLWLSHVTQRSYWWKIIKPLRFGGVRSFPGRMPFMTAVTESSNQRWGISGFQFRKIARRNSNLLCTEA